MYNTAADFYRSREWSELRKVLMFERANANGDIICAECGRPIIKAYDCIAHHVKEITFENLNDCNITLNPDNIELLHARCHNLRHSRFGFGHLRRVFLVYGSPLSGKSSYVKERAGIHDLIIDIDKIYECISNNPMYIKSGRLYDCMDAVKQALFDCIKYKRGKWVNAFICGGFPFKGERERICTEYGAEEIFIDTDKEMCLSRLQTVQDGRDIKEWEKYIRVWWDRYSA